jgi:hypothetical protein
MGCVGSRPQKEDLLNYFWASLPIRKITARRFKKNVKHYKRGENLVEEAKNFREFFMNDQYLVFGNEEIQKVCRRVFEQEAEGKNINHFLFAIALLCFWSTDPKDEADNRRWLRRIDEYLKLNIIKYADNREEWIEYNDLVIIYRRFIQMVTVNSCGVVLSLSETEDKVYLQEIKLQYSESKIDALIRDNLNTRRHGATVTEFVKSDLAWLVTDESCRKALFVKDSNGNKYISSISTSHVVTKTTSEPKVTSSKQVTTYETSGNTGSTYTQPPIYTKRVSITNSSSEESGSSKQVSSNYDPSTTRQVVYQNYESSTSSPKKQVTYNTTIAEPSTTSSTTRQVVNRNYAPSTSSSNKQVIYNTNYEPSTTSTTSSKQVVYSSNQEPIVTRQVIYQNGNQGSSSSKQVNTYESSPEVVKKSVVRRVVEEPKDETNQIEYNTTQTTTRSSGGLGGVLKTMYEKHEGS